MSDEMAILKPHRREGSLLARQQAKHVEVYYEIQWSDAGADDWTTGSRCASIERARHKIEEKMRDVPMDLTGRAKFDFRIVKKTLTEEVV